MKVASILRTSCAAVAMFCASAASAQQVTLPTGGRIVTFGDSLSDNGNLLALTGNPPAPYFNGRFSNGPVWTELIAGGTMNQPFVTGIVTGHVNLAFGGARTDDAMNLNGPIPSTNLQLGTYQALGGQFGAKDTVTVLGGANNIFQYFQSAGAGANLAGIQATSVSSANDIANLVNLIAVGGAGRILVSNLPDIGAAPAYNGNPATAGAGSAASTIFNTALNSLISSVAAARPGTNIVQMDLAGAFSVIRANAAYFGFGNITQGCITVIACVTGNTATQNTYLFWDSVHPTAAGHRLIALYAGLLLNPEIGSARAAPLGNFVIHGRQTAADDTLGRSQGWAIGQYERQNGLWATVTGSHANVDAQGVVPGYRSNIGGMRVGLDKAEGDTLMGGSVGFNAGSISGLLRSSVASVEADVFATKRFGAYYVSGTVGAGWTGFESIERNTGFGPVDATGSTSALQASAAVEAGMITKVGGLTIAPSFRVGYVHAAINGFTETAPMLGMAFQDRSIDAVIGGVKVRVSTPMALGSMSGVAFGELGYERILFEHQDSIAARFINNTAQPFSTSAGDLSARGISAKIGYDTKVTATTHLSLSYGASMQDSGGALSHTGQARLKMPY